MAPLGRPLKAVGVRVFTSVSPTRQREPGHADTNGKKGPPRVSARSSITVDECPQTKALFRVFQEALHNAARHGGVKRDGAQVAEQSSEVRFLVTDSGIGFEMEAVKRGSGLGLLSMQERVRLVNGAISFESKPMGGTTIRVRVPFKSEQAARRAAGAAG